MTEGTQEASSDGTAVRSFRVGFPESELNELLRHVNATRWPERETVTDEQPDPFAAEMRAAFGSLR